VNVIATDFVGLGALISAIGAAVVSVIVALRQTSTKAQINEVHAAVSTSNGETIADLVEKNDARNTAQDSNPEAKP
jgi:hypothetical protein